MEQLTPKQKRFCEEYVKDYNATKAYLRAYPDASLETAEKNAYKNMKKPLILSYIRELEQGFYQEYGINAEHIIKVLAEMAFQDDTVSHANKMKAIDLMQKQLNLQSQRIDANIQGDINISIE